MGAKKLSIILFFSIIVILPIVTFIIPKKTHSEIENKKLAETPKLSLSAIQDKTFMNEVEMYLSDHLIFRNEFVSSKTLLELFQGKKEINGVFIDDKMLIENIDAPDSSITNRNIDAINKFAAKYKGKLDTSIMLIPTALEFYPGAIPNFAQPVDQTKYIQDFYAKLKNITCIDAFAPLSSASQEYIFYKTDHHWTSYGSYIGYTALSKPLGFKSATYDMFNIEHASYDFLGTLYSKVLYGEHLKDKVDLYHYSKGDCVTDVIKYTQKNTQTYSSIFFREKLNVKDKYGVYLGDNEAIVKIKTNVNNNKKLLVFKDSYSHALMQFLPLHYSEIVLVDLRYLNKPLDEFIDINNYQQALFIYNVAGFIKDTSIKKVINY